MNYKEHYKEYERCFAEAMEHLHATRALAADHEAWTAEWEEYKRCAKEMRFHRGIYSAVTTRKLNAISKGVI